MKYIERSLFHENKYSIYSRDEQSFSSSFLYVLRSALIMLGNNELFKILNICMALLLTIIIPSESPLHFPNLGKPLENDTNRRRIVAVTTVMVQCFRTGTSTAFIQI